MGRELERALRPTLDQMNPFALKDFAKRYTAAWCSHDADAVASFFAEHGSIIVNDGDPAVGRAALAEVFQGSFDAFPDTVVLRNGSGWTLVCLSVA